MKVRRRSVESAVSATLKASAMNFADRWLLPTNHVTTAPTSGRKIRALSTYETVLSTSQEPPDVTEAEDQQEDDHDAEDDHPRVTLHLARLTFPQPPTRSDGLEADGIHGSVDYAPIEHVGRACRHEPASTDRVHDPVDDLAVEPVQAPRESVDDRATECIVGLVDPVPLRQHPVDERSGLRRRESLGGNAPRRVHGPGEGDSEPGDSEGEALEEIVLQRHADQREDGVRSAKEHEVPEPAHQIREKPRDEGEACQNDQRVRHDAGRLVSMALTSVLPVEGHEPQSEGVERGQKCGDESECVEKVES